MRCWVLHWRVRTCGYDVELNSFACLLDIYIIWYNFSIPKCDRNVPDPGNEDCIGSNFCVQNYNILTLINTDAGKIEVVHLAQCFLVNVAKYTNWSFSFLLTWDSSRSTHVLFPFCGVVSIVGLLSKCFFTEKSYFNRWMFSSPFFCVCRKIFQKHKHEVLKMWNSPKLSTFAWSVNQAHPTKNLKLSWIQHCRAFPDHNS